MLVDPNDFINYISCGKNHFVEKIMSCFSIYRNKLFYYRSSKFQ